MIRMYYNDHDPPHIHATARGFGESKYNVDGEFMGVEGGKKLPPPKEILVKAWIQLRQSEITRNWRLAREQKPLEKIEPIQ